MSIISWTDKQNVVYPYNEILFNNKRNKVLIHATVSMDLKNIMPSEKSQHTQKTTYFETSFVSPAVKTLHLYCREHSFNPWLRNEDPTCHMVCAVWEWESTADRRKGNLWVNGNVLKLDRADCCTAVQSTKTGLTCHLQNEWSLWHVNYISIELF